MAGYPLLLALLLLAGLCVKIADARNPSNPQPRKFLVPRGITVSAVQEGSPAESAACTRDTCGKRGDAPEPPPELPPEPPAPKGCPGDTCPGLQSCPGQQPSEPAKPSRPDLVDFETLLKDYAFYDQVDQRILTYQGDKKKVRFAPGTKKDPSEPIYSDDLISFSDDDHPHDDCTDSFWGCLVGDLVADVLRESSNETKEIIGEVIETLEFAEQIGRAALDHLEGHPDKTDETEENGKVKPEETFEERRARRKTNYPFLPKETEDACTGCGVGKQAGEEDETSVAQTEESCSAGDENGPTYAGTESGDVATEGADIPEHECCGRAQATEQSGQACGDTATENAEASDGGAAESAEVEDDRGCGCGGTGDGSAQLTSKVCPRSSIPEERCFVSGERKSRGNYPFLEEKDQQPDLTMKSGLSKECKDGMNKMKDNVSKHAKEVMSKVRDSSQKIETLQKAVFQRADEVMSNTMTNLTKTAQATEEMGKRVFVKAGETMSKILKNINETAITRKSISEHHEPPATSVCTQDASSEGYWNSLDCFQKNIKHTPEDAVGEERHRELVSESKQVTQLLQWKMQDLDPLRDVPPSEMKIIHPGGDSQSLKTLGEESHRCNDSVTNCLIGNTTLWDSNREQPRSVLKEMSSDVDSENKSLPHDDSDLRKTANTTNDSSLPNKIKNIKTKIGSFRSSINRGDNIQATLKLVPTLPPLRLVPNEGILRTYPKKGSIIRTKRRPISAKVDSISNNLWGKSRKGKNKKKKKRSVVGLGRAASNNHLENKRRGGKKRRFDSGESLVIVKHSEDEARKAKKQEPPISESRRTFDWKYTKF